MPVSVRLATTARKPTRTTGRCFLSATSLALCAHDIHFPHWFDHGSQLLRSSVRRQFRQIGEAVDAGGDAPSQVRVFDPTCEGVSFCAVGSLHSTTGTHLQDHREIARGAGFQPAIFLPIPAG